MYIKFCRLLLKRLREAGVYFMGPYLKVITLLTNTAFLPWEYMKQASEYVRSHALNSNMDVIAVNKLVDYWIKCMDCKVRFGER